MDSSVSSSVVGPGLYIALSGFISSVSTSLLIRPAGLVSKAGTLVQLAVGAMLGQGVASSTSSLSMASCSNLMSHAAPSSLAMAFLAFASALFDLGLGLAG